MTMKMTTTSTTKKMNIKEEIHKVMSDIQAKVNDNQELTDSEMEMLFLSALIEEEA